MVWIEPFEQEKRMRPMWLRERLLEGEPENYGGRRYAIIALCHSICGRWDIREDVRIMRVSDSRTLAIPLLDDMDPLAWPEPITPRSRWQRLVCWIKKLWRKPVIALVELPSFHDETIQLEAWGNHSSGFYHSAMIGYGPESNVLAWTGMKSVPG